jgi:hypothetical protein
MILFALAMELKTYHALMAGCGSVKLKLQNYQTFGLHVLVGQMIWFAYSDEFACMNIST